MEELKDFLMEQEDKKLMDLSTATTYFAKMSFVDAKIKEIERVANEQIELINAWKKKEIEQFQGKRTYYELGIKSYYEGEIRKNEKFKLNTPYGKVSVRKTEKWNYGDEKSIKNQLKALGKKEMIVTEEKISKNAIKKEFSNIDGKAINVITGEILEGITIKQTKTISINLAGKVLELEDTQ